MDRLDFNAARSRYERDVGGYMAYANIRRKDDILYIDYVFTPPELRGQGVGSDFMKALMQVARDEKMKVTPICGFAAGWLRKHADEYADIMGV